MAGSLILIQETTVSSATATVTLTGIDSTFDVYVVTVFGAKCDTDAQGIRARVTTSGTPDTDSEYDLSAKELKANTTFGNSSATNQDNWFLQTIGTPSNEQYNGTHYLFNFNNSSEFSFITMEQTVLNSANNLSGRQGGGVHTVAESNDGISFHMASGNIDEGVFKMYGLIK